MQFHELTDKQWDLIKPSLSCPTPTGRPRADDRVVIHGILYVLMSGCRWMDMPSKYGSSKTIREGHKKWSEKGIMDSLVSHGYRDGLINVDSLSIDSTTVSEERGREIGYDGHKRIKGSKVHTAAVTSSLLPVTIDPRPGNEHESRKANFASKEYSNQQYTEGQGTDQSRFTPTTSTIHLW